jgi:hypothetical protein
MMLPGSKMASLPAKSTSKTAFQADFRHQIGSPPNQNLRQQLLI